MKIAAVYDANGVILAAVEVSDRYDGPMPVASKGSTLGTFEVPDRLAKARLDEVCLALRVDPKAQCLVDDKPVAAP
jgi:hypothetical protein